MGAASGRAKAAALVIGRKFASVAFWNGWLCPKVGASKRNRGGYRAIHALGKIKI
jgi:hypothetical protein